jgi:FHA domain
MTFGSRVTTVQDFTQNRSALRTAVDGLIAREPYTFLYQAVVQGMDVARRLDQELPLRRAIVMLTDGMDDQQGGAGRQQATDAMAIDPVPIYAIGASNRTVQVDTALKDFSALVVASGGDYRRFVVPRRGHANPTLLENTYGELRRAIAETRHFTTDCFSCNPDGSPIAVRLYLTQGSNQVSSGTVTVRSLGREGKIDLQPPPPPLPPTPVLPPKPASHWWQIKLKIIFSLPWQWLVLAVLALAGVIAVPLAVFLPKSSRALHTTRIYPPPATARPDTEPNSVFDMRDAIAPGTQLQSQRLRITPLGHNELPAQERVFNEELTVGRSQDNQIIIYNDTQVSAKHCSLTPKDGLIFVRDEGSRNGTRVNGVPIERFMHAEPDSILGVGRTELRMQLLPPGRQ